MKKKLGIAVLAVSFLTFLLMGTTQDASAQTVNDYIISNQIKPAAIQNREGTFSEWFPYENGVGKPEGVVIHETADNNATAEDEVRFFNNNWPRIEAYVHAFVDNNEIINIHNTDYGVWGAGPTANGKFIQVELCRTHDYDSFARSIANDAYYTASKLLQYNIPDKPWETIVSHNQVSLTYHETNHSDPTGYFSNWGYSMNLLYDMIGYYYNNLKTTGSAYGINAATQEAINPNSTIKVNNKNGSYVPLVAFNNNQMTKIRNRALANHTAWYTDQTKDVNGTTYRRVATNEWVSASYLE
ncbi:peptidoglycan recognition protein family protein [Companilactobacillus farciminis]|uniref:peptidoglycan recognition protein family protein n=1 Tax=Companilactobacillus farciminis TaxID=1612 RepID=UPI0019164270|nr:peptidoglycan recognition family protein [Companilactobacillus farciminis]